MIERRERKRGCCERKKMELGEERGVRAFIFLRIKIMHWVAYNATQWFREENQFYKIFAIGAFL